MKSILLFVSAIFVSFQAFADTAVWKSNAGGDITEPTNWEGDAVPEAGDYLDFSKITTTGYTLTGAFSDDRIFAGAKFALTGANYVTLGGGGTPFPVPFKCKSSCNRLHGISHRRRESDMESFRSEEQRQRRRTSLQERWNGRR